MSFPCFPIQVFCQQCQTTVYEAVFFVLDSNVSLKTLRKKIGNWLDWKWGVKVPILPSEAPWVAWLALMKTAPQGQSQWPMGLNRHLSHVVISDDAKFL